MIKAARGRVVVTTFASNVARLRAVAMAATAAGRKVVLVGRAMERVVAVARDCGYLDDVPPFLSAEAFSSLPRDEIVVLATGSQGESRAAIARISEDDHPLVKLAPGDSVIFSSRTIPGNERDVGRIINNLIKQGIEVITDRMALIHASGHPRRGEVAQFYQWIRPKIVIPAHGEELHLTEHAQFAVEAAPSTSSRRIMAMSCCSRRASPGSSTRCPQAGSARTAIRSCRSATRACACARSSLFPGIVTIALAVDRKGEMVGVPDVVWPACRRRPGPGARLDEVVDDALFQTFEGLPRPQRRDANVVSEAIEKAVRAAVQGAWGKRPAVHVLVVEV